MTTETLIDSEPQNPDPGDSQPTNGVSERKRAANRANSGKSTGPTSKMGKRAASQNSFKNGYYSAERRRQLMAELDEDPAERERLRKDLYASYPPGAPIEDMLLDGLTDDFWKRGQLDRLDADVKLRELQEADREEHQRDEEREGYALDLTASEIHKGGLVRQKDSAGKFKLILDVLGSLLRLAESGELSLDQQGLWMGLYGSTERNWYAGKIFARLEEGETGEAVNYKAIAAFLKREVASYTLAQARYLSQHQPQTEAEREARLVSCSGDALILFKEMEVTNRQLDRKLQLLLKVRAERFAREEKEASRQEEEGGKQKAEGRPSHPKGGPDGDHDGGSAEIPPRKPVQRAVEGGEQEERKAKGKEPALSVAKGQKARPERNEGANGKSEDRTDRTSCTFDLQTSTFDCLLKNEATDLLDNKGSASAEVRNEATAESSKQPAESGRQSEEGSRQEARKAKGKEQKACPERCEGAKGNSEDRTDRKSRTFDLRPSTLDFSKNEATDLLDNKGSASAEIRNEATVESSRQSAVGSQQSPELIVSASAPPTASSEPLPTADCLLPTAFRLLPTAFRLLPTAFCRPPTVPCILAGEESSALVGVLLCAGNRRRSAGSVRPVPCPAHGSKYSLHPSGGQPLPAGRADRATRAPAADGREPGVRRLRLRGRHRCHAVRVSLPSRPCQPPGGVRPELSRPHRRPAGINPAPHGLWPSIRSGTGIGPKRRAEKCRFR